MKVEQDPNLSPAVAQEAARWLISSQRVGNTQPDVPLLSYAGLRTNRGP